MFCLYSIMMEVAVESYTPTEKQLAWVLNLVAIINAVLLVAGMIFIYLRQGPGGSGITHTPLDTNGVASLGLLLLLAWFAAAESLFVAYGGRPRWGKLHTGDLAYLGEVYPRVDEFRTVRDRVGPDRLMATGYLHRVLGP